MTPDERRNINNGIWLCERCASTIDQDVFVHTVELLNHWKRRAEDQGLKEYQAPQLENGSFNIREEIEKAKKFLEFSSPLLNDLIYSINENGRYYPSRDLHVLQHIGVRFGIHGWNTNNPLWSYHPQFSAAQEYIIQLCEGLGREFRHNYSYPRAMWSQPVNVIVYKPDIVILRDIDHKYLNNIALLQITLFDTLSRLRDWVYRPW
ncbi:MAG: hypothetical protein RI567_12445 [Marinobacter sp.]|nr:hypothetical protein [Marinobacter sp.]